MLYNAVTGSKLFNKKVKGLVVCRALLRLSKSFVWEPLTCTRLDSSDVGGDSIAVSLETKNSTIDSEEILTRNYLDANKSKYHGL